VNIIYQQQLKDSKDKYILILNNQNDYTWKICTTKHLNDLCNRTLFKFKFGPEWLSWILSFNSNLVRSRAGEFGQIISYRRTAVSWLLLSWFGSWRPNGAKARDPKYGHGYKIIQNKKENVLTSTFDTVYPVVYELGCTERPCLEGERAVLALKRAC